jgi:hypothetical protein
MRAHFLSLDVNRTTPQMRRFAKQLIAYETPRNESSAAKLAATFPITDKLRPHLATLMGIGGFRALLSRALALAGAEVPWLRALHVKADGALEGLQAPHRQLDAAELLEGKVVLLAQLLGLLVAFIGTSLTLRLVSEIWPQIALEDMDFGTGGDDEKAK